MDRSRNSMVRVVAIGMALTAGAAFAYEQPRPRYIIAEVTWRDPRGGTNRTDIGQMWFGDLPIVENGRTRGFGRLGYYDGIKWFVPDNTGDVWIARMPEVAAPPTFLLHDYLGEKEIVPAFTSIDVVRTESAVLDRLMDETAKDIARGGTGGDSAWLEEVTLDGTESRPASVLPEASGGKGRAPAAGGGAPAPLRFATDGDIGVASIAVTSLVRIAFLEASDGLKREKFVGRYVEFSQSAAGDAGRVQVKAATFFGGADGNEQFVDGGFLADGAIMLAANFTNLGFVTSAPVEPLGVDPAADAYPATEVVDGRGRKRLDEPRRTGTLAFFSDDLRRLTRVVRLAWGSGTIERVLQAADGALYLYGTVGPHFDAGMGGFRRLPDVDNPEAVAYAAEKKQVPGPDTYVLKLMPGGRAVAWAMRFKHSRVNLFVLPDGRLLARRGDGLYFVTPEGEVAPGPRLEITGGNMAVDPRTGDMYFGGSYRSATGLEPYVNPYLYKVSADGRQAWTAYGWSGPIVGVERFRLVADSAVTGIRVAESGDLTVTGWSDGGNTVLSQQPYDLRRMAPGGGFASSVWGATGGLTVRIAHIIHMHRDTMEVDYCTKYVSYLPPSDVPTLVNIYDYYGLPNGDVAITGGSATGYIETHDAWVQPWYIQYRTNPYAEAKGGTFFTLFAPGFNKPRMATRTPGVSGGRLAGRGNLLLLYCGATGGGAPPARPYGTHLTPIVKHAVQPANAGGLDGYAMLIDTQGEPNPPTIPDWTWGERANKGRTRR